MKLVLPLYLMLGFWAAMVLLDRNEHLGVQSGAAFCAAHLGLWGLFSVALKQCEKNDKFLGFERGAWIIGAPLAYLTGFGGGVWLAYH